MRAGRVARWDAPLSTGPALTMLAVLSTREPLGVLDLLPRDLNGLDEIARAYLDEALIHAWWSLDDEHERLPAPCRDEPRQVLQSVAQRDVISIDDFLATIPSNVRPFAARGVIIARLALIGRGRVQASEAQMHEILCWSSRGLSHKIGIKGLA